MKKLTLKDGRILYIIQDEDPQNPRTEWDNDSTMVCWHNRYQLGDNGNTRKGARERFEPPYPNSLSMFADIAGLAHPDDMDFEEMEFSEKEYIKHISDIAHEKALILPLKLYDHSGITISIGSGAHWADPGGWDSGQVGWIFMTYAEARKNFKVDENDMLEEWFGPNKGQKVPLKDIMQRVLEGDVKTYDQYLTGDVYGFKLVTPVTKTRVNKDDPTEEKIETEEEKEDSCWGFFGHDYSKNGLYEQAGIKKEDIVSEEAVNAY